MNKWISSSLRILPKVIRQIAYRRFFKVPSLALDKDITIEVVRHQEDFNAANELVLSAYKKLGLIQSSMNSKNTVWSQFEEQSTVIVAKYKGRIVGTITLVKDSKSGLPCDKIFYRLNEIQRNQGYKLVEVSAFAVSEDFRKKQHAISLLLMKYIRKYSEQKLLSTMMICTVNPRAVDFYEGLIGFSVNSKVCQYSEFEGAPAIHLSSELSLNQYKQVCKMYSSTNPIRNLMFFFLQPDSRFIFP